MTKRVILDGNFLEYYGQYGQQARAKNSYDRIFYFTYTLFIAAVSHIALAVVSGVYATVLFLISLLQQNYFVETLFQSLLSAMLRLSALNLEFIHRFHNRRWNGNLLQIQVERYSLFNIVEVSHVLIRAPVMTWLFLIDSYQNF